MASGTITDTGGLLGEEKAGLVTLNAIRIAVVGQQSGGFCER